MKQILIPTDFSENAWLATLYALRLYQNEECVFHLLNTYTPAIVSSRFMAENKSNASSVKTSADYSERQLKRLLSKIENEYPNARHYFETYSSFSLLGDEVRYLVEKEQIDLIVMGAKGISNEDYVFMGKNTVKLLKYIRHCPILAVPSNTTFEVPNEISFYTNFDKFYTRAELTPLLEMVDTFKAIVRVVHLQHELRPLNELEQFNLVMLRKYFGEREHYIHTISQINTVSRTLRHFNRELNIHLLALLNFRNSYMDVVTSEPQVEKEVFSSHVPFLVIPEMTMALKNVRNRTLVGSNSING